jgi:hypothetical protein
MILCTGLDGRERVSMMRQKVQFRVSIASADWSYQVGQVAMIDVDLATSWRAVGHVVYVNGTLAVTDFSGRDGLLALDCEQALRYPCALLGSRAFCAGKSTAVCAAFSEVRWRYDESPCETF